MYQFAERVGWKMQKRDEELVQGFCNEVGVDKAWVRKNTSNGNHNDILRSNNLEISNHSNNETTQNNNSSEGLNHHHNHHHFENESHVAPVMVHNGAPHLF
uniref:ZF-HD dimerization-type domain-containing protein n=1 Tax=Salix viminalis TaxID=40686 RepID=A0A6N2L114_SALVM